MDGVVVTVEVVESNGLVGVTVGDPVGGRYKIRVLIGEGVADIVHRNTMEKKRTVGKSMLSKSVVVCDHVLKQKPLKLTENMDTLQTNRAENEGNCDLMFIQSVCALSTFVLSGGKSDSSLYSFVLSPTAR